MSGYDIGVSVSTSSAAQSGPASSGDFNVAGRNAVPWQVWAAAALLGALLLYKMFFPARRR